MQERSLIGGSITLHSQGDVLVSRESTLDISGGQINFLEGFTSTSRLLGEDGRVYEMSAADPTRQYARVLNGAVVQHGRWGVTQQFGVALGTAGKGSAARHCFPEPPPFYSRAPVLQPGRRLGGAAG